MIRVIDYASLALENLRFVPGTRLGSSARIIELDSLGVVQAGVPPAVSLTRSDP